MKYIKGVGALAVGIAFVVIAATLFFWMLALGVGFIQGAARIGIWLMPYMAWACQIALLVSFFILAPMALFHKTRGAAAAGFVLTSFVYGILTWVMGLLITMQYWGPVAVVIGLLLFGVGVVPVGMLAAAFHSSWLEVGMLAIGLFLTFGSRMLSAWLVEKYEHRRLQLVVQSYKAAAPSV